MCKHHMYINTVPPRTSHSMGQLPHAESTNSPGERTYMDGKLGMPFFATVVRDGI